MDDDKLVWAPDATHGFTIGKIVDIGSETISVEPLNSKGKVRYFRIIVLYPHMLHFAVQH